MKSVRDILQDADPLRDQPSLLEGERHRLRQAVVMAAADVNDASSAGGRRPVALLAALTLLVVGIVAVGSQIWSGGTTLQAAIRFEVRLAEDQPGNGLFAARVAGSDRVVFLHQETVVTNDDIARSRVVAGNGMDRLGVEVQFTEAGAQKMRQATASHIGKPVAILIDGDVVGAPVLRSPIGGSAVISGDYTRAEADRIVDGIGIP